MVTAVAVDTVVMVDTQGAAMGPLQTRVLLAMAMAIRATGAVPMAEVGEEAGAAGATEVATGSSEGSGRDGMPRT